MRSFALSSPQQTRAAGQAWGPWFLLALFGGILVWEEVWDLPNTAYLSAWLLLLITAGAMVSRTSVLGCDESRSAPDPNTTASVPGHAPSFKCAPKRTRHPARRRLLSRALTALCSQICSWFFERRLWCRHLCPIGGMNGMFAKLSMTELRARQGVCSGMDASSFLCRV